MSDAYDGKCPSTKRIRTHNLLWPRWATLHCELIANHAARLHQVDVGMPHPLVWIDYMADDARAS